MNKIIGEAELQRRFRSVIDEVVELHTPYILTRGSRPEAVLVPYDQYVRFVQADEAGVLKQLDDALSRKAVVNAKYSESEVAADLKKATRIARLGKRK